MFWVHKVFFFSILLTACNSAAISNAYILMYIIKKTIHKITFDRESSVLYQIIIIRELFWDLPAAPNNIKGQSQGQNQAKLATILCFVPFYTTNWQKKSSTPLLELSMTTTIRIKEGKTPSETKLSFTYRYSSFRLKVTQLTEELYFDRRIAAWLTGKQWRIFPGIPEQQLARAPAAAAVASHHTVAVKKLTTSSFTKKEAVTPKKFA